MDVQLLNKPDDIIQELQSVPGIYLIKIKCISCSEDAYIDYKDPEIYQNTLRIGVHSFPLNLIEQATIKYKINELKFAKCYKVESQYLKNYLSDSALIQLAEFQSGQNTNAPLSEDEKIELIIKKYQLFFDNSNADIAKSMKGRWGFFRYSEKLGGYKQYRMVESAEELDKIAAREMLLDIFLSIEFMAHRAMFNDNCDDMPQEFVKFYNNSLSLGHQIDASEKSDEYLQLYESIQVELNKPVYK